MGKWSFRIALGITLALTPGLCSALSTPSATVLSNMHSWRDSVTVEARRFAVPARWRGLRIGLRDQAPPDDLLPIPEEFSVPGRSLRLRIEALAAFVSMARAAADDGVTLLVRSAYRSPADQGAIIASRLAKGRDFDEITWGIAPPGYSEHMLGTVVDLQLDDRSGGDPAYIWLRENAAAFGFVEGYPPDPSGLFPWEPWHWCYRGQGVMDRARARTAQLPGESGLGG